MRQIRKDEDMNRFSPCGAIAIALLMSGAVVIAGPPAVTDALLPALPRIADREVRLAPTSATQSRLQYSHVPLKNCTKAEEDA